MKGVSGAKRGHSPATALESPGQRWAAFQLDADSVCLCCPRRGQPYTDLGRRGGPRAGTGVCTQDTLGQLLGRSSQRDPETVLQPTAALCATPCPLLSSRTPRRSTPERSSGTEKIKPVEHPTSGGH